MAFSLTLASDNIAQVPPSILNTLPALQPPPGVESVLFCFMVCLFANRVYTKLFVVRKVGWDDLSCTIAFLGSIAVYIATLWGTLLGPVGKHQWDVRLVDILNKNFIVTGAINSFLGSFSLLFTKLTFFLLYFEIFWPLRWLRISVYIGATLTCASCGAVTILQIVLSTPKPGGTWLELALSAKFAKNGIMTIPLGAIGLGIDIALLIIPMVAIEGLHLPTRRKIGIVFIFMFGILACIGSLLSLYYRVKTIGDPDVTRFLMPLETVGVVELFVGVSCACMPAFSKMIQHHHPALAKFRSVLSSRFASLRSSQSGGTTGQSGFSQSDGPSHCAEGKPVRRPYCQLEVETRSPGGATPQPTYELGQVRSIQTFLGKGSDDQIHLTHESQQQQTRTR